MAVMYTGCRDVHGQNLRGPQNGADQLLIVQEVPAPQVLVATRAWHSSTCGRGVGGTGRGGLLRITRRTTSLSVGADRRKNRTEVRC